MKKNFLAILLFLALQIFAQTTALAAQSGELNINSKNYNVKLQIFDANKKIAQFSVALAQNQQEQELGLMYVTQLHKNNGMLFLFEGEQILYMWMKNTKIPLDMIFIDQNGIIVNIVEHTEPMSLKIISSQKKADKVLEINAGLSKKLKIKTGQKIVIPSIIHTKAT